jgi:16S rRNA (cytosine967-C5)-methyltransferase
MNMELLLQHGKVYQPWAIDRSAKRLQLVKENLQRCRMACKTIPADAAEFSAPDALKFELVTCDVPCSNTGVFRHRPDALWRWSRQSLNKVTLLQKKILCNAAELTAPGGLLLYSTCSLEAEENQLLIDEFVAQNPEFELKTSQLFLPDAYCDGTFAALLQRKKTNGQDVVVQA